jgi:hypothetical protein
MPRNSNKGIIIIDILLALSLAALYIALITGSSLDARNIFYRAKERSRLLDIFENGTSTELRKVARPFGNDMFENDFDSGGILFYSINAMPGLNYSGSVGTPLCSVDFFRREAIGAYDNGISPDISINPIILPINPLLPLTDLEVRNNIAYVSSDSATALDPDLFVIDIHNKNSSVLLSSINTGPGIAAIALAGKRIFAAAASAAAELHIIKLNSLNSLVLEKKFQLPLPYASATPPYGSSISYNKGLIYLGTEKWDGDEFSIIDVGNPTLPVKIGGFEIGSKVNDIVIRDKFAYIADSDDKQLKIVDIGNVNDLILANSFSPSGGNRQEGKAISLFEDGINFGRTSGGFDITSDHEIFSFATTSSTTLASFQSANIPGGVYGIVSDRSRLYMATREVNKELRIMDYGLSTSTNIYYSLPVAPQTIACDNGRLYILAHSAPVIYEISFN